ncbi:hypothetical protein [Archangium sp.]|uniref:hypothetical protein n=1 Tax=Archangium sp. TaxID=1872627 RepID=UPI00389A18E9
MRNLPLVLAAILSSCVRSPFPPPGPVADDTSIALPRFYDRPTVAVGEGSKYYFELDGEMLRAVAIATSDFLPPRTRKTSCGNRLEGQRYIVTRQGDIIFVYIYEDSDYCGGKYAALDSGVKYAISKDGRILRRVFDGEPEEPLEAWDPDGGVPAKPGVVPGFEPIERKPSPASPSQDGGSSDSPSPAPEGRDGGSSPEGQDGGAGPLPLPLPSSAPDGGAPPDGGTPDAR